MSIHEQSIKSWDDFPRIASILDIGNLGRDYAFRGQADCRWELQPSLLRKLKLDIVNEEQALSIEKYVLGEFKS